MKLYIRHSHKAYRNGFNDTYSFDPPITEEGRTYARTKFAYLLRQYGAPEVIVCSPYLRTRQTAEIARAVLMENGHNCAIYYDNSIAEHITTKHRNVDFTGTRTPMTELEGPPKVESLGQYRQRITKHVETNREYDKTWYITHGGVIQSVASQYNRVVNYPNEVCGIAIDNNGKVMIV